MRKVHFLAVGLFAADWICWPGGRVRGHGGRFSGPADLIRRVRNVAHCVFVDIMYDVVTCVFGYGGDMD